MLAANLIRNPNPPPTKLKVYAPNGDTKELKGHVGIRAIAGPQAGELYVLHENGSIEVLSKKVVVQNLETGEICYNPRIPLRVGDRWFLTSVEVDWLRENPHWPAVLELWDNPVENGEGSEGIHP